MLVQVSMVAELASIEVWSGDCWNGIWPRPTGCILMEVKSAICGPASWIGIAMEIGGKSHLYIYIYTCTKTANERVTSHPEPWAVRTQGSALCTNSQ